MKTKSMFLLFAFAGCTGTDLPIGDTLESVGPEVVASHLVWVNQTAASVVWVDPSRDAQPRALGVPQEVQHVAFGPSAVLVLGRSGEKAVLDAVAIPEGDRTRIDLDTSFERALVSPSGRFAVLVHDAKRSSSAPFAAQNHNEIAIVDIVDGTSRRVSLDTESTSPRNVVFDPDETRAAIVLDAAVVVVALGDDRRVKVPLKLPGGERLTPEQVLFAPDGAHVFLRTSATPDVVSLALSDDGTAIGGSLNFLAVPGAERLLDLAVPSRDAYDGHVLAVFSRAGDEGGSLAARIDANGDTATTTQVGLDGAATRVDVLMDGTVLLHGSPDVLGAVGNPVVAGWDPQGGRVEEDKLAGPAMGPPAVGDASAFFLHEAEGGTATALTSLAIRRSDARLGVALRPLVLGGKVKSYASSADDGRVVLGVDIAREDSGAAPILDGYGNKFAGETGALAVVSPQSLEIETIVLDDPVVRVGVVGDYFFAVHEGVVGDVTLVPRDAIDRADALRFDGVLLTGQLDQGEQR